MSLEKRLPPEKCEIRFDETGDLMSDVFFEFNIQYDRDFIADEQDSSWYVVNVEPHIPFARTYVAAEVCTDGHWNDATQKICECSASTSHVTRRYYLLDKIYLDLIGDDRIADFVPATAQDEVIVSRKFRNRLGESDLKGMEFDRLKIGENQSRLVDPDLHRLKFTGKIGERPQIVVSKPNSCPHCGKSPLICPECGFIPQPCENCGKLATVGPIPRTDLADKRLRGAPVPVKGRILLGKTWDGKDFVSSMSYKFITKRALDWLLMVHAKPFYARPARVLIEGMSAEQRRWLKEAQGA